MAERDGNGRFLPGQSGNPAGKAPGTLSLVVALRRELEKNGTLADVAVALVSEAKQGNVKAIQEIFDRIDGKVPDKLQAQIDSTVRVKWGDEDAGDST